MQSSAEGGVTTWLESMLAVALSSAVRWLSVSLFGWMKIFRVESSTGIARDDDAKKIWIDIMHERGRKRQKSSVRPSVAVGVRHIPYWHAYR